jgi:hypothetical protein
MDLSSGPRGPFRRLALAGLPLLLVGALSTACGNDDDPSADPTAGSSSGSSSASPSAGDSSSTAASDSPSATPATGPELSIKALTVHLPDGWKVGSGLGTLQVVGIAPQRRGSVAIGQIPAVQPDESLASQAKFLVQHGSGWKNIDATILPTVSVGDQPAYHVVGRDPQLGLSDQIGLVYDGVAYTFNFDRDPGEGSEDEWAEIIDSVLASAEWKA